MTQIEQAKNRAAELWLKMCEWDGVSPSESFVVFSETNPYQAEYDAAMGFLQSYWRFVYGLSTQKTC